MKTFKTRPPGLLSKLGAIALSALAIVWLPNAEATTSEGATIENIATVSWQDSDLTNYNTTAYVQVTVDLATNPAVLSGRPTTTGGEEGDQAPLPAAATVLSGATANYLYAITATANGSDIYDLSGIQTDATSGVGATDSISWQLKAADGTTDVGGADPGTVTLGSAVVAATPGAANVLSFPGGSLAGFAVGDIVVIGNVDYEISVITPGVAPNHGTTTLETLDTMTFIANADGSNTAPSFDTDGTAIGDVAGEQQLLQVSVTATIAAPPTAGTVNHDVVVDTSTGGETVEDQDKTTTFNPAPVITVTKFVRNVLNAAGNASGAGATVINTVTYYTSGVTGEPGDTLEYVIRVNNANGATQADNVVITDPIPAYTSYVAASMRVDPDGTGWDPALNDGANDAADPGEFDATAGANGTVYIYAGTGGDDGTTAATYNDGTGGSLAGNTTTYGLFQVTID